MNQRFEVRHHVAGHDEVLGHFYVRNGSIIFESVGDQMNCDMLPAGPMSFATRSRLQSMLNHGGSTYVVPA